MPPSSQSDTTAAICERCNNTGLVVAHGAEDYGVSFESEYCEACDYGQALTRIDQLEADLYAAQRARDDAQIKAEMYERHMATVVRWGMGPNLQSSSTRSHLEKFGGVELDAEGWIVQEDCDELYSRPRGGRGRCHRSKGHEGRHDG